MSRPSYTDEQALDALRAYATEHGEAPSISKWKRARRKPSPIVLMRKFGSWNGALERAGLSTRGGTLDEQTARIIQRVNSEVVTVAQIADELGVTHAALARRIRRYEARHNVSLVPRHGMSAAEKEDWQLTRDPRRQGL